MQIDLSEKTIFVTGAAGRLGQVLSHHLLNGGAHVIGADLRTPTLEHDRFRFVETDLLSESDVRALIAGIDGAAGKMDALIHTVGTWAGGPLGDTSLDDFETMLRINLTSTFLCFREATRYWQRAGRGGRLVAIASMQGLDGGVAQQAAYSAAKAGVVRLVESTAREFAGSDITAAAVAPSMILFGEEASGTNGVSADHVAGMCAYLASDAGAAHSGAVIRTYGTMLS